MSLFDYFPPGTRVKFKRTALVHGGRTGTVRQHTYLNSQPACFLTPDEGDNIYWHSYDAWWLTWFEKLEGPSLNVERTRKLSLQRFTAIELQEV